MGVVLADALPASDPVELCAQEPIRIPGAIQPHGALILLDPKTLTVLQGSDNVASILGWRLQFDGSEALDSAIGASGRAFVQSVETWAPTESPVYLDRHEFSGKLFDVSGHRGQQGIILEFEEVERARDYDQENFYPQMREFLDETAAVEELSPFCTMVARQVQTLSGFNRVMIYRFDADWNGTVIAEHGDGALPSYLDLRFPASDIPAQARELYRLNRLRLIPAASYEPVGFKPALCPVDEQPLDLSMAALRSVSPVHLEYMRNMGTGASMSISIVIDGKLWGLISCHHAKPFRIGPQVRTACDFLGRIVAQQISSRLRAAEASERLRFKRLEGELVAHLARAKTFQEGLVERARQWLGITEAAGAAVTTDGIVLTAGATPSAEDIRRLTQWIHSKKVEQLFATDNLAGQWSGGEAIADVASGVLAVPISRIHASYILWFRPEVVRTVTWGGNLEENKSTDAMGRLHPRRSFDGWKEIVRLKASPWREAELFSAAEFRNAVINFVLQRAEELAEVNAELTRSNKELESFSYSISHDLRAPFRHIVGYAQLLGEEEPELKELSRHYLDGVIKAAMSAGQLVDDLLHFSQLGRASLSMSRIDMNKVAAEVRRSLETEERADAIDWQIGDLPPCWGDTSLVRQAFLNLVDNAVKYSRSQPEPRITITGVERAEDILYSVADNGVGFDMAYAGKLFQVFHRLHRQEDFEGTGIGLALTKRIVDRHGGTLEASGAVGRGATFKFSLPRRARIESET